MADLPFLITAALIAGTLFTETPILSILTGIIAIGWIVYGWIKPNHNLNHHLIKMLLFAAIATLAYSHIQEKLPKKVADETSTIRYLTVIVTSAPEETGTSITCTAKVIEPFKGAIMLRWPKSQKKITYGNTLKVSGQFMTLQTMRNPGQFDQAEYLRKKGFIGQFKVSHIHSIRPTKGILIKKIAIQTREKIHQLHKKTLESPYAELYIGLIFGDSGINLPRELKKLFKATGLTHLIVVSGSQVALLVGILLRILTAVKASPKLTMMTISFFNLVFFFITGGEASIFRAILMAEIALTIQLLNRKTPIAYVISLTISLMIIINPVSLFDIGAYLSFAATMSLIWIAPKIEAIIPGPKWIKPYLSITLAPFICTLPIVWHLSNSISFTSIVTNLMMVSWIECLVVIGFASTCIGVILPIATQFLNNLSWVVLKIMLSILPYFSDIPWLTFNIPHMPIIIPLVLTGLIITTLIHYEKKHPHRLLWISITLISISGLILVSHLWPHPLKITFLDVDQGDSTLIETPNREIIMIDVGKNHADSVLIPALHYKGIDHIDLLILTHFDLDHYGSLKQLITEISITTIIDNGNGLTKWPEYQDLLKKYQIQRIESKENSTITLDPITIKFLGPPAIRNREELSENNQSILCKITAYTTKLLFTGDLEEIEELEFISRHEKEINIDILKLGHHGSKTSTTPELLEVTTPKYAIVSAGRKNRYGHPSKIVMERIHYSNIIPFETPKSGAIECIIAKEKILWKTFIN
jgi:competence protein ComEC